MTMRKTLRSVRLVFKSILVGSVVVSRVFAAPTPVTPSHDALVNDWRSLGDQMGGNQSSLPLLNGFLVDMIASADLDKHLSDVVNASYEMVDRAQVSALDAHWAQVLTASGNPALVVEFLNLRSAINTAGADAQEVDNLVWLAKNGKKDGCDGENNGHGNGDQNAPGNSCTSNNAENADCV